MLDHARPQVARDWKEKQRFGVTFVKGAYGTKPIPTSYTISFTIAHIYGTKPVPTSFILPFMISRAKGAYGTILSASLPNVGGKWGYVTGISLNLGRSFSFHGKRHTYLSAGCPAPKGVSIVSFPFARASFAFAGGQNITSVLTRSCRAL